MEVKGNKMLFMSLCILDICGLVAISTLVCKIPAVKREMEKLLKY